MGNKDLILTLLYRGSRDGEWRFIDFHSRCDEKGPTVSLFQVKDGPCIGGFTNAPWKSGNAYAKDESAMLFNLTDERHYTTVRPEAAICCATNFGPLFGWNNDLGAMLYPLNGENNCISCCNNGDYNIKVDS